MAYGIYFSSTLRTVLATIISSLVFEFIIFRVKLTFLKAVVIILKHATFLRLSNLSSQQALRMASLHYQQANSDLKIQEYLTTCQVQSVTQFVHFIMATNIGLSIFALEYVKQISH